MLEESVLVVAHPDDEVLWFGSILPHVGRIIIAFKEYDAVAGLGQRRADAMAELPYKNLTCLDIPEAGSLKCADWDHPVPTEYGLALTASDAPRQRYEENFAALRSALSATLRPGTEIYTHNPWGEYGHEDHVQVYRVLESLSATLGLRLWTSHYYGARSATLAGRYRPPSLPPARTLPIDRTYARHISEIYQRHDCWTWTPDWVWPETESFLPAPFRESRQDESGWCEGLRFVESDFQ
ncbi:MAG: hypothetical protein R3D05_17385 [Dongiaceae bacterium]